MTTALHHSSPRSVGAPQRIAEVWDRHGGSVYALACVLLGDETRATQAVTMAMADYDCPVVPESANDARRSLARHVYRRSQEVAGDTPTRVHLPPVMVWLEHVAQLQRECLALCVLGGQTHREAATLLGVSPRTVAELLTAGLREVERLASGGTAIPA